FLADGDNGFYILRSDVIKSVENIIPYSLFQNYPNPFHSETTFQFSIPKPEHVILKVFDVVGREIETVIDGIYIPGEHNIIWEASHLPSGIYFYKFQAENVVRTKKFILVK
ncbi:MAG: T9SS type A sorting domain-containing protein, partial [Candidatus Zixiibacteriota bacterium]